MHIITSRIFTWAYAITIINLIPIKLFFLSFDISLLNKQYFIFCLKNFIVNLIQSFIELNLVTMGLTLIWLVLSTFLAEIAYASFGKLLLGQLKLFQLLVHSFVSVQYTMV